MSPEQLQGREVTVRSDIYSFGLLLYELVTGRRAIEGHTVAELTRKHRDETPIDPSMIVPELDPVVERTILACLEKQPQRRPPSAAAALTMLSRQDPLEAVIAAGETPSPELVAAAGETQGMRPALAWTARRDLAAAFLIVALLCVGEVADLQDEPWLSIPPALLIFASYVMLLLRFGVLAAIVGLYALNLLLRPVHSCALGSWTGSADSGAPARAAGPRQPRVPDGARQPEEPAPAGRRRPQQLAWRGGHSPVTRVVPHPEREGSQSSPFTLTPPVSRA